MVVVPSSLSITQYLVYSKNLPLSAAASIIVTIVKIVALTGDWLASLLVLRSSLLLRVMSSQCLMTPGLKRPLCPGNGHLWSPILSSKYQCSFSLYIYESNYHISLYHLLTLTKNLLDKLDSTFHGTKCPVGLLITAKPAPNAVSDMNWVFELNNREMTNFFVRTLIRIASKLRPCFGIEGGLWPVSSRAIIEPDLKIY